MWKHMGLPRLERFVYISKKQRFRVCRAFIKDISRVLSHTCERAFVIGCETLKEVQFLLEANYYEIEENDVKHQRSGSHVYL